MSQPLIYLSTPFSNFSFQTILAEIAEIEGLRCSLCMLVLLLRQGLTK
ncbi:hypothetical protein N752_09245 [Desulforamulus aquiferis]|nr:hypothetical protein N752_09245 [Desulforamulus aquiferis]